MAAKVTFAGGRSWRREPSTTAPLTRHGSARSAPWSGPARMSRPNPIRRQTSLPSPRDLCMQNNHPPYLRSQLTTGRSNQRISTAETCAYVGPRTGAVPAVAFPTPMYRLSRIRSVRARKRDCMSEIATLHPTAHIRLPAFATPRHNSPRNELPTLGRSCGRRSKLRTSICAARSGP